MGEEDGRLYMVMELLEGEHAQRLPEARRQAAPLERALDMMRQVCEGLAVAHAHGIVHRDIKPGNMFVLHDGGLKILDFGVARLANSSMTASGFIVGTPDFMSPEQARGSGIDQRSDIFSAGRGVLLHALRPQAVRGARPAGGAPQGGQRGPAAARPPTRRRPGSGGSS